MESTAPVPYLSCVPAARTPRLARRTWEDPDLDYEIRAATQEELPALEGAMSRTFGGDPQPSGHADFAKVAEMERTRCVFDGEAMVGTCGAYSLELTLPGGGSLPMGGTTYITVRATHRRRGLLRAMMASHLQDIRDHGEAFAGLWASESSIYRRFGYGVAAYAGGCSIDRHHAAFARPLEVPGAIRQIEKDEARTLLPRVYDQMVPTRPGHFRRHDGWWDSRLADPPWDRDGGSKLRFVVYEEAGEPRGYLQYRVRQKWADSGLPEHVVMLNELQACDANAHAALWRFALEIDLSRFVNAWNQPVDEPLPWLLADPRRLTLAPRDGLWLRPLDVPRMLEARAYPVAGRIVIGVRDEGCPDVEGGFELDASPDGARCKPTDAEPELTMDAAALGSIYLGGARVTSLARANRIEGDDASVLLAERLFHSDVAPWCPEIF